MQCIQYMCDALIAILDPGLEIDKLLPESHAAVQEMRRQDGLW